MPTVFQRSEECFAMTMTRGTRSHRVVHDVATDFCRAFPALTFFGIFLCGLDTTCGIESFIERAAGVSVKLSAVHEA